MIDPASTLAFDYDAAGRQLKATRVLDGVTYVAERRYEAGDRVLGITYPDGDSVGTPAAPLGYDAAGRLQSIPAITNSVAYDALGRPVQMTAANGVSTSWEYHARGWLARKAASAAGTSVQDLLYTADEAGRVTSVASPFTNEGWGYAYDELGRLTSATSTSGPADSQTFSYDAVGNMTYNSRVGTLGYPTAGAPRPHAPTIVSGDAMAYDFNGNLLSGRTRSYAWNASNLPTLINGTQFAYDGLGERLKKVSAGSTSIYPLGDDYEVTNGVVTKYVSLPGLGVLLKRVGATTYWLHTDRLGSIQAITESTGLSVQRRTYRPYGDRIADSTSHTESRGWIDQRQDQETGLTYLHARYYDSALGLFVSPDPLDPVDTGVGLNRYAYLASAPTNGADRAGLSDPCTHDDGGSTVTVDCDVPDITYDEPLHFGIVGWGSAIDSELALVALRQANRERQDALRARLGQLATSPSQPNANPTPSPSPLPPSPKPAPNPNPPGTPPGPPNASVRANVRVAEEHRYDVLWFASQVRPGGPWDYKELAAGFAKHNPFEDFGNFNYGATARALGLPIDIVLRGAGFVQLITGNSRLEWNNFMTIAPYGDQPRDQVMIEDGIICYDSGLCK